MGRYTTVQAFADNSGSMRAVSYDQAVGAASAPAAKGPVQTEKVENPYGSTAGAGSGEFHVYRHARAREMARWKEMHASEAERMAEEDFQRKVEEDAREEAEKTEKRRRKREREKNAKRRKKNMKLGGVGLAEEGQTSKGGDNVEDEFDYAPIAASEPKPHTNGAESDFDVNSKDDTKQEEKKEESEGKWLKEPLCLTNGQ